MAEIEIKTSGANQATMEVEQPPPTINLNFPEKGEIQPIGMDGLSLKDKVTVVITGKVSSISSYSGEWGSRSLGVDMETCRIEQPGRSYKKQMSLGDAVNKNRRYVESDSDDSEIE